MPSAVRRKIFLDNHCFILPERLAMSYCSALSKDYNLVPLDSLGSVPKCLLLYCNFNP